MQPLDFLIIGAQKAGTTTLYRLLSEHPQVFVPPSKELPFFTRNDANEETFKVFRREHFSVQPDGSRVGKVTPQYLCDPAVSARLKALTPQTRLVVILRDPVERAYSHYRMSLRRGLESRSFAKVIDDMLEPTDLAVARTLKPGLMSENRTYVVWGEYGRLLAPYKDEIAQNRVLILSTRGLECNPKSAMNRLLEFLGLSIMELPSLGKKFHKGGTRQRLPIEAIARKLAPIRWLWRRIPRRFQARIVFEVSQWNVSVDENHADDLPTDVAIRLRAQYAADTAALEALTGWHPDWLE